jgi:DNA mismatch repair protein MutS2
MPLEIGTVVAVRSLANKRGVVIDSNRRGRYRVQVEGLSTWCREQDLVAAAEPKKKKKRVPPSGGTRSRSDESGPAIRVDLHGFRVEEAIAQVITEIDHALRRGADRVEIVHGRGSGRIRDALHEQLAKMPIVASFRLDPANPGVTWVHFAAGLVAFLL